jgi:hypothetical protein
LIAQINLPSPLETLGLNSHLTPVKCAKEGGKSKTGSAVELFSEKTSGGGAPHEKVENNYLAGLSRVDSAKPEGRRKRWLVKEITRF